LIRSPVIRQEPTTVLTFRFAPAARLAARNPKQKPCQQISRRKQGKAPNTVETNAARHRLLDDGFALGTRKRGAPTNEYGFPRTTKNSMSPATGSGSGERTPGIRLIGLRLTY
jgi:hypothetical protein